MKKPVYSIGLLYTFLLLTMGFTGSYAIHSANEEIKLLKQEVQELKISQPVEITSGQNIIQSEDDKSFILKDDDGYITVYLANGNTVYEYTAISVLELPTKLQEELKEGKIIATSDALYSFLENYSS